MNVFLIEPSGRGGIAHYTYGLVRAIGECGIHCEILTGKRWVDRPLPETVQVRRVFSGVKTNPLSVLKQCIKIHKEADIVHWQSTTHPKLLLHLMRFIPKKRIPWVFTVHNVLPHDTGTNEVQIYREIYQKMDGLIYHTHYTREEFSRIFPKIQPKSTIIPHAEYSFLDVEQISVSSSEESNTILFFGNIRPYKGLDTLIRALNIVKQNIPDARLRIVGQPLEPFDRYAEMIDTFHLKDSVDTRLEYIPDEEIPKIFSTASVVTLPYRQIDQSGVLMLALALSKAVVAAKIGGIPEVIQDGKTGILIEPHDEQALADALIALLHNPQMIQQLGHAAREDVLNHFSWNSIAGKTIKFYEQLKYEKMD